MSDLHVSGAPVLQQSISMCQKGTIPQAVRLQVSTRVKSTMIEKSLFLTSSHHFLNRLFYVKLDNILNVGDSAYSQLQEIRENKDKSTEWERTRHGRQANTDVSNS